MQSLAESPFAAVVGLGGLKSLHTPSSRSRLLRFVGSGILAAGGLAMLLAALYLFLFDMSMKPSDARALGILLLLMGGLFALFGGSTLIQLWRKREAGVAIYESGFAYKDSDGVQQVRWEDIDAVWQNITKHYVNGIPTGTTYVYTVLTRNQKKYVFDKYFPAIQKLGTDILQCTSTVLFPRYWQALQSGQSAKFGPLAISLQGLTAGNKTLNWSDIKAVKIQRGVIAVKKEGRWFNWAQATVPQIPNFYVFYELVRRFTTVE